MRHVDRLAILLIMGFAGNLKAQTDCGCDRVSARPGLGFAAEAADFKERDAQRIVDQYSAPFTRQTNRKPFIVAKPFACPGFPAFASLCPPNEQRYIFYNKSFFDELNTAARRGDQFVLAHEIAHHVLGHTVWAYFRPAAKTGQQSLDSVYRQTIIKPRKQNSKPKTYTINIPRQHIQELEADALGLWMSIQNGTTRADINQIFSALPTLLAITDTTRETSSHPSLAIRRKLIEQQWTRYESNVARKRIAAIGDNLRTDPFADSTDETTPIREDVKAAYAFELLTADQEMLANLNKMELSVRDTLTRRSRSFVDIVVGWQYQRPSLTRNQSSVESTDSRSIMGGLRLGIGPWYRPHRVETDLLIVASTFTTHANFGNDVRLTERFQSTYLYIRPRYVFSQLTHAAAHNYRSSGWMATAGLSLNVPLTFRYVNYGVTNYQTPAQRTGVAPIIGLGYGMSNWVSRKGHIRVWLMYQPQPLRLLPVAPNEGIKATLHTLSLDCSFRFW